MEKLYISQQNEKKSGVSWTEIPNEIRARIVGFLDTQTSVSLKQCGREEANVVRKFANNDVDIYVKFIGPNEMYVVLMASIDRSIVLTWEIKSQSDGTCSVIQKSSNGTVLNAITIEGGLAPRVAFRVIGRLIADPMFYVKVLDLQLGKYDGPIDFGLTYSYIGHLLLNNVRVCNTIKTVLLNFNFNPGNLISVYDIPENRRHFLIEKTSAAGSMMKSCTFEGFGNAYSSAFPSDCLVQSFEDGKERIGNIIKSLKAITTEEPSYLTVTIRGFLDKTETDIRRSIEAVETINNLMILRAAYSADPVDYLKKIDEKYAEKIGKLRMGMPEMTSDANLVAWISLVYLAQFFTDSPMRGLVYGGLHSMLKTHVRNFEEIDFQIIMTKVELLMGRKMEPKIQFKK